MNPAARQTAITWSYSVGATEPGRRTNGWSASASADRLPASRSGCSGVSADEAQAAAGSPLQDPAWRI
jgi:hypothetical protein